MNYILTDLPPIKENLLPLTYFRPIAEIRLGIDSLAEKWKNILGTEISYLTDAYLQEKFPVNYGEDNIYISSHIIANMEIAEKIKNLKPHQAIFDSDGIVAYRGKEYSLEEFEKTKKKNTDISIDTLSKILFPWDIISLNERQIHLDFERLFSHKESASLSKTNLVIGKYPVFIEEGAKVEASIFNTEEGPIYIGKKALIMEGSMVRGPFALLEGAVVKMGAKIYGGTSIGPYSKVGGEVKNTIFIGNSNKAHDGYLGDSVIAEWCNLGADTNNSNLKNNYSLVKMWNYPSRNFINTGLQFCGLIMGDHSKAGIATMFNTGTIVGVSANIFGGDYQPKFFPSFKWGNQQEMQDYKFDKTMELAKIVMQRRNKEFNEVEKRLFENIYKLAKQKESI